MSHSPLSRYPVLVTGAEGFIGSRLVRHLAHKGIPVRALTRRQALSASVPSNIESIEGDLLDPAALSRAMAGCRSVVHLAGKAHDLSDPSSLADDFLRVNVEGTRNLLHAATDAGTHAFCFISSVKAMGEGGDLTLSEDATEHPSTSYGTTKLAAERLVAEVGAAAGMRWNVLRLPLVYGPGVKGNFHRMIEAIDRGRFPPPPRVPNRRSLVSVDDVVRACDLVVRESEVAGRTYLVTDGHDYSAREIYELIVRGLGRSPSRWAVPYGVFRLAASLGDRFNKALGRTMPFDSDKLAKLLGSAVYSSERIRSELGFRSTQTLADVIPEMITSYRESRLGGSAPS